MRNTFIGLACALAAAASHASPAATCHLAAAAVPNAAQRAAFDDAAQLFAKRRFPAAYGRFVRLADAGHTPSAQLALLMHEQGLRLFGSNWDATGEQLARWNSLTACEALRRLESPGRSAGAVSA